MMKKLLAGVAALAFVATAAWSAGYFPSWPIVGEGSYCFGTTITGGQCSVTVPAGPALTGNELVPADTGLGQGINPATVLIPSSVLAGATFANSRNLLGNGALNGTQVNGTGTVTGATTSAPTSAALTADRWVLDTNVGSGAGRSAIVTSTPSPPPGFTQVATTYRTSGVLTQPICEWQAVPTPDSTAVAGQTLTFSVYAAALAGLAADNANVANLVVITGTGTDQGFNGSWTATPAITPAWTGIATAVNTQIALTTTFARYSTTAAIPAAATEIGVGICFTPTASGAGSTDGIAWVGTQLERGAAASLFEFKTRAKDLQENQAFVWSVKETAGPSVIGMCSELVANTSAACYVQYSTQMYKVPTVNLLNCGTACFAMPTTVAETAFTSTCVLVVNASLGTYAQTVNGTYLTCTQSGTTATPAGLSLPLVMSASGTGQIIAWTGL